MPESLTWTTPDGAHKIEIEPRANRRRAWCRCGWTGKTHPALNYALIEAMNHLAKVTHE